MYAVLRLAMGCLIKNVSVFIHPLTDRPLFIFGGGVGKGALDWWNGVWNGIAWYGLWHGMVWYKRYGMLWYNGGIAWHGGVNWLQLALRSHPLALAKHAALLRLSIIECPTILTEFVLQS